MGQRQSVNRNYPGSTSIPIVYDSADRRSTLTLPNGIVLTYTYDNDSRVTAMTWTLASTTVGNLQYQYDADSRVTEKTGSFAQTLLPAAVSGNTFNLANEMTAFNGTALTYDANGNLTNDGTNTYSWDARNHLVGISGGSTASFAYDADGRRSLKSINGTSTQLLYDGLNPVQEIQSGAVSANMLTGLGIDEYFQRTDSAGARDYLTDILGSSLALTDSTGTIQTQYSYDPFGNSGASGQASSNPYQFTGRENDGTGLDYYRARYYRATTQRFIAQDPIGFRGGDADLYTYVRNNPVNLRDPNGKGGIGAAAVGCACLGYTVYSHYSNFSQLNQLGERENQLSQLIDILVKARNDSDDPAQIQELQEQIDQLELDYEYLAGQYARDRAWDVFADQLHEDACIAATLLAGGTSPL